ncbi:MAG TPA: plastocyanin/azurin family copper-binding protein, partial [Gemmatimonadales bacterium]
TGLVVWTWHSGGITHNITFTEAITGSGDKATGTFTHVFTTPGTYHYHCTIHSGMTGTVVVAAPSPAEDPDGGN